MSKLTKHLNNLDQIIDWQPLVKEVSVIDKTDSKTLDCPQKDPFWPINATILAKGLLVKKGTNVDASIFPSSGRPLSKTKREALAEQPSSQIDTDATSTRKGRTFYFGYKGHIGADVESYLIRKATFTPANVHDSTQTEKLISYDESALFGDKAYMDGDIKVAARQDGWYYGVLDRAKRGEPLSSSQNKRGRKHSRVRVAVEHPFAWMKTKANLVSMRAKNAPYNKFRFVFACMAWNVSRARFLLERSSSMGVVTS